MKLIRIISILIGMTLLVTACSSETETESLVTESQYGNLQATFNEGQTSIEVSANKTVFSIPVNEMIVEIKNNGTTEVGFGEVRYLEKLKSGTWYKIPYENLGFGDISLALWPEEVVEQEMPLEHLDYKLTEGNYRIVKTFDIDSEMIALAAEFEIRK